jgi:nuclear pore complex protein Nup93
VHSDSGTALMYYMLTASIRGGGESGSGSGFGSNSLGVKGALLRELLAESRDFGTLLGGGGAAGSGGALSLYVADAEERSNLLEAVAYECQVS